MAALVTIEELRVWAQKPSIPLDDPFATFVIDAASLIVCETALHPDWTITTAPARARLIAAQLAKRTYLNPNAVTSENIGPLGERRVEDFARTLELTDAETEALVALIDTATSPKKGLWVQPVELGTLTPAPIYAFDDSGSDWAIPWINSENIGSGSAQIFYTGEGRR